MGPEDKFFLSTIPVFDPVFDFQCCDSLFVTMGGQPGESPKTNIKPQHERNTELTNPGTTYLQAVMRNNKSLLFKSLLVRSSVPCSRRQISQLMVIDSPFWTPIYILPTLQALSCTLECLHVSVLESLTFGLLLLLFHSFSLRAFSFPFE